MSAFAVEGNMLDETADDLSSSSSSESESESESEGEFDVLSSANNNTLSAFDDDEEEIEVFSSSAQRERERQRERQRETVSQPAVTVTVTQKPATGPAAVSNDGFGIAYQKASLVEIESETATLSQTHTHIHTHRERARETEREEEKEEEEDDEFAVCEEGDAASNAAALERALDAQRAEREREAQREREIARFDEFLLVRNAQREREREGETLDSGDGFVFRALPSIDEPLLFSQTHTQAHADTHTQAHRESESGTHAERERARPSAVAAAAQQLKEIVDIYAAGMGDQEVLLLDSDEREREKEPSLLLRKQKSSGSGGAKEKARAERVSVLVSKEITAIAEEDEEEEEEDDVDVNTRTQRPPVGTQTHTPTHLTQQSNPLTAHNAATTAAHTETVWESETEREWAALDTQSNSNSKGESRSADVPLSLDYDAALHYLHSLDLSVYAAQIVTGSHSSSSSSSSSSAASESWFSRLSFSLSVSNAPAKLVFDRAEETLQFPFLLAQLDYDPHCAEHLAMLRGVARQLLPQTDARTLQATDARWERLGFQGKDPRTDVNRSMKMLAILQMLAFLKSHSLLAKYLFDLSLSAVENYSVPRGELDVSWPFFCVSIMFTKEALQTLRAGALNELCNASQSVLPVLHEYHHALFAEFGRLLKEKPKVHHAVLLAEMRAAVAKQPLQVIHSFRSGSHQETLSAGLALENLTDIAAVEETGGDEQCDNNSGEKKKKKNIFKNLFKTGSKADKFSV